MDKFDKTFNDLTKGLDIFEPSNWKYFQHCPLPSRDFNEEISLNLNLNEDEVKQFEATDRQNALENLKSCLTKDESTKVDDAALLEKLSEVLPLSKDLIKYVCNPLEFWTHIYIDLFNGLQKIYWLKFKDLYDWEEFINVNFASLNTHVQDLQNAAIVKIWEETIGSNSFYFPVLIAIKFVDPSFYREIVEKLKNKKIQDD